MGDVAGAEVIEGEGLNFDGAACFFADVIREMGLGKGEGVVVCEGSEMGGGGGVAFDDVVGVVDGEAAAGFEEGDEEGGGVGDAEGAFEDVGFEREVAAEGGVGAGDDDDVVVEFLEDITECFVEVGGLLDGKGAGVGEEVEDGRGLVDGVADGVGGEVGEDGDVEDGLGAGGVVIEHDEGFLGLAEEIVDFPNEVFFELGWKVGEEFGFGHGI